MVEKESDIGEKESDLGQKHAEEKILRIFIKSSKADVNKLT